MFEKIGESLSPVTSFSQLSPEEQRANLKRHKDAIERTDPVVRWVRKKISRTEWKNILRFESRDYCYLREEDGKIVVGFMVVNTIPVHCELMTNEELYIMNEFCRSKKIFPTPFKEKENE